MPGITLQKLKADSFNPVAAIESMVEIDTDNLRKSLSSIQETISDIDSLREAIFFKEEKLKRESSLESSRKCAIVIERLERLLGSLNLPPLGDTCVLLQKNKEILELKRVQKFLRYYIEVEKTGPRVLQTLLCSENKEDWLFLGDLLYYSMKYGNSDRKSILLEYSKKLEAKLVGIFRSSLQRDALAQCAASFEALSRLEKETVLLDEYIFHTGIFEQEIQVNPPSEGVADLDAPLSPRNDFSQYIHRLMELMDDKTTQFHTIFGRDEKYNAYFFNKTFRMAIFRALDRFLDIRGSALFLKALLAAYDQMEIFGKFVAQHFEDFSVEAYVTEGFSRYIARGIEVEKELFDELFSVFVYKAESKTQYILMGQAVTGTGDYLRAYESLLYVVDMCERRGEVFYALPSRDELLRYFYRKMTALLEEIMVQSKADMEIIREISGIFLLTRRYFKERITVISEFSNRLSQAAKDVFGRSIRNSLRKVSEMTKLICFTKPREHAKLFEYTRECIYSAEVLKGKNYNTYILHFMTGVYGALRTQILSIVYSSDQKEHLNICMRDFISFVVGIGHTEVTKRFFHLKEICELITVGASNFIKTYEEFKGSFTENELRQVVKCRKDKAKIKEMMSGVLGEGNNL